MAMVPLGAGFGYTKTDIHKETGFGGDVAFKAYVYAEEDVTVTVEPGEVPEDWTVDVQPTTVTFPPQGQGFRYTETGDGYRKIVPIRITVDVPTDVEPADYQIPVRFVEQVGQQSADATQSAVTIRHGQEETFTVTITGGEDTGTDTGDSDSVLDTIGNALNEVANSIHDAVTGGSNGSQEPTDADGDDGSDAVGQGGSTDPGDGGEAADDESPAGQETQDAGKGEGRDRTDPRGLTGAISVNALTGSTTVQVVVFLLIWSSVGVYWYRRREQNDADEERPWKGSLE